MRQSARSFFFVLLWFVTSSLFVASAASAAPAITSPTAGSTLAGKSQTFAWEAGGSAVTQWWLYVGSSKGTSKYYNSNGITATTLSKTVTTLPTDGSTVYVRLWYYIAGWKYTDITYTASIPNSAPTVNGTPATTVNVGESYSFIPTASDADNDTKTFNITNQPTWAMFDTDTGALSGTPAGTDVGTSEGIVISVTDGKSTPVSLAAFNVEVIQPNRAPAIEGTPATAVNVGESYNFTPTASDEDGDTKTFTITNKPAWAVFDEATGVLSGTPEGTDVGTSAGIVISVTDGKSTPVSLAAFNVEVIQPNRAPAIEGTPATAVNVGESYNFTPTASDADNDTLTFDIANKPAWATFDTTTGALTGTPAATDAGTTSEIVITITDSKADAVSLSAFAITVTAPVNLARQYGVATQSTTYSSSYPASNVIDGNTSNFNHTNKSTGGDWWQVKLPATASLSSIVVKNRNSTSYYGRLAGATVYVSNQPATVGINEADKVATLEGIATNTITLNPQRQGMYVIVKAGSSYLHMAEVEVFGFASAAPGFEQPAYNFNLNYKAAQGAAVGTTKAGDFQADALTYSIDGNVPFAIDTQGNITLAGTLKEQSYSFNVKVSDGANTTSVPVTVATPINFAREFGIATEGGTYTASRLASLTIDGNTTTANHTSCDARNWWQVSLPNPTQINKIVVKNATSWQGRLNGAVVYVTDAPYTVAVPTDANKVSTLTGSSADQIITFATPKTGSYVIVKNAGVECLHMAEVEVYGQAPATPAFAQASYPFYLSEKAAIGAAVGTTKAVDYQFDALAYSIEGNVPFAVDAQGKLTLTGALNHNLTQRYDFKVIVSDGVNSTSTNVAVVLGKGNGVVLQRWDGIVGTTSDTLLNAAHYKDTPDFAEVRTTLDAPDIANDIYAQKLSAILVPAETGDYQFAVAGNYFVDLRLSTDAYAANAKSIAQKAAATGYQAWASGAQSAVVHLEAGKAYYIEAIHIADDGSDHVSVAWKRSSDAAYGLIPANLLYQDAMSVGVVKPAFTTTALDVRLEPNTPANTVIGKATAVDPQGDALTYSIAEPVPFAVDAQGNIRVTQALNHNTLSSYNFTVKASDSVYEASLPVKVTFGKGKGVFLQRWNGITGSTSASLLNAAHYQDAPDYTEARATLDAPDIANESYVQKLSAILIPAEAGDYQFAVAGNYVAELKLSSDVSAANAKTVAQKTAWTGYQAWSSGAQSSVIHLEAGKAYYIEALHIADGGTDHVSVAWKRAADATYSLIPAELLHQDALSAGLVKPTFAVAALDLRLEPNTPVNTVIGKAPASDPQGDTLTYSIAESVPFAVDAQGNISVTQAINHNALPSYAFTVKVTDGVYEATLPVTVTMGKGAGVLLQRWDGITGSSISALTSSAHYQNDAPDYAATLGNFTAPDSGKDNFGQRLTGFIKPTQSGKYQFAIIGDDNTQLRLSTNAVLEGAPVIASQNSWGNYQEWASAGVSALIDLEAGQVYALEALHKEGGGADHVSVAWKRQGDSDFSSLPADAVYQDALSAGVAQPFFAAHQARYLLPWNAGMGTQVAQIQAIDPQGDVLTYALSGSDAFAVDATGNVTLSGSIQPNTDYALTLTVNDGVFSVVTNFVVRTNSDQAVQEAIQSGNADAVTADELLDTAIAKVQAYKDSCQVTVSGLYPNGLDTAAFPSRSAHFKTTTQRNIPLHVSNDGNPPKVFSWIGAKESGARYAVLGTDVFSFSGVNVALKDNTLNVLNWLLKQSGSTDILNQPLTLLVPDYWDREGLKTWVAANGLTHQWTIASDANLLNTGAFDVYLGSFSQPLNHIQSVLAQGKPIAMFNSWYEPSADRLAEFGLTWEWYGAAAIGNLESVEDLCNRTNPYSQVQTTLESLKNGLPDFIYEASDCPVSDGGNTNCDETRVTDAAGNSIATLFNNGASVLRSQIIALDAKGISAFSSSNDDVLKLAILLGDKYRAAARFPMDKETTDDTAFFRSLFADFTVHYSRPNNAYQPDMGRFTTGQAALHDAETLSKTLTYTPTTFGEWTSTGLYVPPGKAITVRRTDSSTSKAKLRFNMLGDSMVHIWEPNAYNRPRYLSSTVLTLEVGKTYTLSTPRGGPVYIGWEGVASGATPFTVEINGVLENPLLDAFDELSVQSFLQDLELSDSDWVDIKTPYVEVHTPKSYMRTSFAQQDGDKANGYTPEDVQAYVDDLNNYLIAGNYAFAGFSGAGLPALSDEVRQFCDMQGLSNALYDGNDTNLCADSKIHVKPKIQHINADAAASCGALCAGNPFDSGSPIMPLDWGENHEMGHNLQRGRLNIYSSRSGETSNNIFPLHTQWAWTVAQGLSKHPSQTRPSHQEAFNQLQAAIAAGTAANSNHPMWFDGSDIYANGGARLSFYIQLAYSQQSWEVYTKLYLMERIFSDAIKTDAKWAAAKDLLGFGSYTRTEAAAINTGNDFMYVAASKIAGKDYSNYFSAWGIEVSAKAKAQVAANGFVEQVPALFYYVHKELPAVMPSALDAIPLDGVRTWVDPTP